LLHQLEYRQETGSAKKLPNRFRNVQDLQSVTCRSRGDIQPNQPIWVRSVNSKQDSFAAWNQLADLDVEAIVHTRYQSPAASHAGGVTSWSILEGVQNARKACSARPFHAKPGPNPITASRHHNDLDEAR
jgi:hypothetical protein